jgi:hypothetical protein
MIVCGWCHADTAPERCSNCGHDPVLPWFQRAEEPPVVNEAERRFQAVREAEKGLRLAGLEPTVERIAERLDVSPRTVQRWRADGTSAT